MQKFLGGLWKMPDVDHNFCMGYWDACDAWDANSHGVSLDNFIKAWIVNEYRSIIEIIP